MVRAVTNGRARADITGGTFAVGAAHAFKRGFGADTGSNLMGAGLDSVMHPVIDALAFLSIRVVHDDGVAEGACGAGVPGQCR
ncbi:hypothetical protein D3C71_738780 [compost metagenome]